MKILVACEESQVVTKAFRAKGHEAYSCDILPCSGNRPEWHAQEDVLPMLRVRIWDMIIAFPPCTYLSNAGACHLYPKKGELNQERYQKGMKAAEFFMAFYNHECPKIAIENPISSKIFKLPDFTQEIQPYMFGHPYKKKTRLWLKGLPPLMPTNMVATRQSTKIPGNWYNKGGKERQKNRSKTFQGIADAMANQWGADK